MPQVIGALTGLLIAGVTFFFENIDKKKGKEDSAITAIKAMKTQLYHETKHLLLISISAILLDVGLLGITPWLAKICERIFYASLSDYCILLACGISVLILNVGALRMLYLILRKILDPNYLQEVNTSLAKKENKNLDVHDSVTPQEFLSYFITFEKIVRQYFPYEMQKHSLLILINQLAIEGIISKTDINEIKGIINKRNIFVHGGDIGRVDNHTINFISKIIAKLENELEPFLANRRMSRMEEAFKIWIDRYVEDFSDAEQLDHAVRYEKDYGRYMASRDGERLYLHIDDGKPLYIRNKESKKLFLKTLEGMYSIGDGLSS